MTSSWSARSWNGMVSAEEATTGAWSHSGRAENADTLRFSFTGAGCGNGSKPRNSTSAASSCLLPALSITLTVLSSVNPADFWVTLINLSSTTLCVSRIPTSWWTSSISKESKSASPSSWPFRGKDFGDSSPGFACWEFLVGVDLLFFRFFAGRDCPRWSELGGGGGI